MTEMYLDYTLVFTTSDDRLVLEELVGSGEARNDILRGLARWLPGARGVSVEERSSVAVKPLTKHLNAFVLPLRIHATLDENDYDLGGFADCVEGAISEFLLETNPTLVDHPDKVQLTWDRE